MIRQTVFGFRLERTDEALTAHGGLALLAGYNQPWAGIAPPGRSASARPMEQPGVRALRVY